MARVLVALVVGVALVAVGLWLSPVPWVALLWVGGVLIAAGLFGDVREDTK